MKKEQKQKIKDLQDQIGNLMIKINYTEDDEPTPEMNVLLNQLLDAWEEK